MSFRHNHEQSIAGADAVASTAISMASLTLTTVVCQQPEEQEVRTRVRLCTPSAPLFYSFSSLIPRCHRSHERLQYRRPATPRQVKEEETTVALFHVYVYG